ncbi:hypothetical protein SO802_028064 [Lithocarpus litseifolius]|uniref:Uncharacterized protein n=1 Tax=Lithocarpus litseifolius TaxID=425828 RepID=A0AAW2BUR5_9ROSI
MLNWVKMLHERGEVLNTVDQRLGGRFDEQQMKCLLVVQLWCAHSECDRRPSIREAIQVLNFEAPLHLLQFYTPRSSYHTPTMNMKLHLYFQHPILLLILRDDKIHFQAIVTTPIPHCLKHSMLLLHNIALVVII